MAKSLEIVAAALGAPGGGILAADESTGTIKKRFDSVHAKSTEETRRNYREMLFQTEVAMRENISGVILYDETIRQKAKDGTPLVELIKAAGTIPGIKVDQGAKPMAGHPGELVTEGLTGLRDRLADYYELGARFAKWRAVINIASHIPTPACIRANMHALARYAALCQEANIVPIVEPEVLMDGDHDIERCYEVTEATLRSLFAELYEQRVNLEGTVLKPSMVISGSKCTNRAGVEEVAEKTVHCFRRAVPAAIPSIVFLSGGQSDLDATAHLNAINSLGNLPWQMSFSYGRALQAAPLKAWSGKTENEPKAQAALAHRAAMNGLATQGAWKPELEKATP
ncbi:MAG: fructose-bisphosphate aldolase class I [Rhodobiaceae bacterium]|nr:MAG: fructose-bisphosphate aldolase class I [Rhodobiaceae bacterium]